MSSHNGWLICAQQQIDCIDMRGKVGWRKAIVTGGRKFGANCDA